MKKSFFAWLLVSAGLLLYVAFYVAYHDDMAGERSLAILTPAISAASKWTQTERPYIRSYFVWTGLLAVAVVLLLSVMRRTRAHGLFFLGFAVALSAQFLLVDDQSRRFLLSLCGLSTGDEASIRAGIGLGVGGYFAAFLILLRACSHSAAVKFNDVQLSSKGHGWVTFLILLVSIIIGTIFRTYALNQHLNIFEGELSPYSAAGTSLTGMFYANRGYNGPWAPLGLLYYLPIYLTTSWYGTTLLALRFSSALVGVLTIPLVFALASKIAGRAAGIFATALFSLNCLHIGWSRTDIHPHGVTTWPTLILCLFLLKAVETKKIGWALGVAFMMGLSWHQYPSGQSAVLIPLLAVAFSFVMNRGVSPVSRWQLLILFCGLALWVLGLPLSYYPVDGQLKFRNPFTLTGPRALWGAEEPIASQWQMVLFVVAKALSNLWDFTQGVFFKVPYLFHQEWLPYFPPLLSRSVPWFVASLGIVALALLTVQRKRFETAVLVGWLVAGLLPGILSSHAYPKRLSTVFPLIDILAGISVGFAWEYLRRCRFVLARILGGSLAVSGLIALTIYSNFSWFSGIFHRYGEPPELAIAREFEKEIAANTIVVAAFGGGYEPGKFLYLMLDHLSDPSNQPNLYYLLSNSNLRTFASEFVIHSRELKESFPYKWTKLGTQVSESLSTSKWNNVNFLMLETLHNNSVNTEAIELIEKVCLNPNVRRIGSPKNTPQWNELTIVSLTCPVSELSRPIILEPLLGE